MDRHEEEVNYFANCLKSGGIFATERKTPSNVTREKSYKSKCQLLNLDKLNRIIAIDGNCAIVEPAVTMEQLLKATLKVGMIPEVLPEFRGITVGGAIMGAALESSSHRYGLFSDSCDWYEVLLGSGEKAVLREDSDLYHALPGSYGSLALLTLAAVRLIPAKPYVQLSTSCFSIEEGINSLTQSQTHFVDGLVFGDECFVMEGNLTNQKGRFYQTFPWSKWFYQRVEEGKMTLPISDYLFRYDRGAFWMGRYLIHPRLLLSFFLRRSAPHLKEHICDLSDKNPPFWFRLLLGWAMGSQKLYAGLHSMPKNLRRESFLIQDSMLPAPKVGEFLSHFEDISTIWLCPVRAASKRQFLAPNLVNGPVINVGTYGEGGVAATKRLESLVRKLGGRKALYSDSYYSKEEFWNIYDRDRYERMRTISDSKNNTIDIFKKTCQP